eukprot:CAMPEP_0119014984 /NCGR_PEP_ID=MMETSP1176-20130426/10493_1 /TAXON_ID=265551 /ORGANISM="Synedropsis recta cf, Strain CCMP1620" /LENGTH=414 /DNA_ID=CAMNT_0006968241 /DNA_START=72 /DNA_END=1316 /DNA_ORIENTATION=+
MAPVPEDQPPNHTSTVARIATLLGAFRLKNMPQNNRKNNGCLSTLFSSESASDKTGADSDSTCSVPSLLLKSLTHQEGESCSSNSNQLDKIKVEEHASCNLSRMLVARPGNNKSSTSVTDDRTIVISELPLQMLDNLASSFLTLVDARLRAYITILARHGVSLSECPALSQEKQREGVQAVERKLETLIKIGTGVTIANMVTFFRLDEASVTSDNAEGDAQHQEHQNDENNKHKLTLSMPLVMETTMDVSIPKIDSGNQLLTVGASTTGTIKASFNATGALVHVQIEVETHHLLAKLIDRASLVMSTALDIVTAVCALPPQFPRAPLPKHDSEAAAMPPPKPVPVQVSNQLTAVVSPDITCCKRKEHTVSSFQLDQQAVDDLSPESCANIVDFVIGEVNDITFPPLKRLKNAAS